MNRSAGLGYADGALVLITCLTIVFVIWRLSGQTFSVEHISTFRGELLYWIAIPFSNTLGTSTGDFLADNSGLGFRGGALVIIAAMVLILAAHYLTPISGTLLSETGSGLNRGDRTGLMDAFLRGRNPRGSPWAPESLLGMPGVS